MKHATVYLIGAGVVGVGALALLTSHRTPTPAQSLGVLMPGVGASTDSGISVPRSDPSQPSGFTWSTADPGPYATDPVTGIGASGPPALYWNSGDPGPHISDPLTLVQRFLGASDPSTPT